MVIILCGWRSNCRYGKSKKLCDQYEKHDITLAHLGYKDKVNNDRFFQLIFINYSFYITTL